MSLILEALKKAEQERNAGQAPAVQEVLARPAAPTHHYRQRRQQQQLLLAIVVCAALVGALLLALLWPRKPAATAAEVATTPTAPAPAATAPVASVPAPTLRVDPERLESPSLPSDADAEKTEATDSSTMDELVDQPPPTVKPETSPRKAAPASDGNKSATAAIAKPATPAANEPAADATASTPPPAAAAAAAPTPQPIPPPPPAVRPLQDMPVSFRQELPKLTVDVHFYDANPLRRFAIVNGKKYREGDTLVEGPRVSEITRDGVVIEHKGSKVLLELPH